MTDHAAQILVAHGDSATITVEPIDAGLWYRKLDWYWESKAAQRLYAAYKAAPFVFDCICYLRNRSTGLAEAPLQLLCDRTGLSETTIYDSKTAILRSPDALARETSPKSWVFQPFPGRLFAGRAKHDSANPDPIPESRTPVRERGLSPSHSPSAIKPEKKTATTEQQAGARGSAERDAVVVVLLREGLERQDAERIAATATPAQVRKAIANADYLARIGKLKSRRGYIVAAIKGEYALFAQVEEKAAKQLAANLRSLEQSGTWPLDEVTTTRIHRQYDGDCKTIVRLGVVAPSEIETLSAEDIARIIANRTGAQS